MAKSKQATGKMSMSDIRKLINKKAGRDVAHNLQEENPTDVKQWIPTGSRWLDSIIATGKLAGIPVGKFSEIAGLEGSGKSYLAAGVAANAQKMGIQVAYFDSESAIDSSFLERAGCDLEALTYIQAESVEFVLETIELLLANTQEQWLFIWDSLALTPSISDIEGDFNPQSSMAVKPRILAKGFAKITQPIANANATLLILNQLKTNITSNVAEAMTTPYVTPGGKAAQYAYSLRIWLTKPKGKATFITDENQFRIGSTARVKLEKSRFGTTGRRCEFQILWGAGLYGVQDEESWLEAIKGSERLKTGGAWYTLITDEGNEIKFQRKQWLDKLQEEEFRKAVFSVMDEHVIMKFKNREGNAADFYGDDDEEVAEDATTEE
jgi:recombination protein RecA